VPGATNGTYAAGINDRGQVGGTYDDSKGTHVFVDDKGTFTTIDVPGATNVMYVVGINDRGEVVGYYFDSESIVHSFIADIIGKPPVTPRFVGVTGHHSDVISADNSQLLFVNGLAASTVFGGGASVTVLGGVGGGEFHGGTAGHNRIYAGLGAATLFGGGDDDMLYAGGRNQQALHAGAGNETLSGSLASGADTFFGGSGNTTVTLGLGQDVLAFVKGNAGGTDLVTNFTSGADMISLKGYGPNEVQEVVANQTYVGGTATINLNDGTAVTFANLAHKLTSSDFK
jgi:Ca2+-binding RTX toxin-like protein